MLVAGVEEELAVVGRLDGTLASRASVPSRSGQGVLALSRDFAEIPRSGDTVFGFAAGLYPTDFPTLPDQDENERT